MRFRFGKAALVAALIPMLVLGGCTAAQKASAAQTTMQIMQDIVSRGPSLTADADLVVTTVEAFAPPNIDTILGVGDTALDTASKTIVALATAYVSNPTATTLAKVQASINALQAQVNSSTATLHAFGIKNPQSAASVKIAIAALSAFAAVATTIFAKVQSTETPAQVAMYAQQEQVKYAEVRAMWDQAPLQAMARANGITTGQFFDTEARLGY